MHRTRLRGTGRAALVLSIGLAALAAGAQPTGAQSASEPVVATVTASSACITVEASSVDFGTNPFSTDTGDSTGDENAVGSPDTSGTSGASYALTNCGSGEESFLASGTDATDTGVTWSLDDGPFSELANGICNDSDGGTNRYRMDVVNDADNDDDLADGDSGIFLSTSSKPIPGADAVAGSGSVNVGNRIVMPCTGSDGANVLMSSTITYTATLN